MLFFSAFGFAKIIASPLAQPFDKTEYYNILKSGSLSEVSHEMDLVNELTLQDKEAFAGALQMKKAGLLKIPKEKLDNFKKGAAKLETVLRSDTSNVEHRFLRLIIQEHAPKVVKYRGNIADDAAFIRNHYKELSPDVQKILIDYSQTSKALMPTDLAR